MQVINRVRLRDFWTDRSRCETELRAWFQLVSSHDWALIDELTTTFPHLHTHLDLAAFDIRGSSFFVIATIDFDRARLWIRDVLTNREFNTGAWQALASEESSPERTYQELVDSFPLRPIAEPERSQRAMQQLDDLLTKTGRTQDEQDYLDVLTLLIHDHETQEVPIPPVSGAEVLRSLVLEHRLSQMELIPLLGGKQKVQALLTGARPLELRQATRACRYFKLPPEVFMDPDDLEIELPAPARRRR